MNNDEDKEFRFFFGVAIGAIVLVVVFIIGVQLGIHRGKRSVPESVKLGYMKAVQQTAQQNAIRRLKMVGVE